MFLQKRWKINQNGHSKSVSMLVLLAFLSCVTLTLTSCGAEAGPKEKPANISTDRTHEEYMQVLNFETRMLNQFDPKDYLYNPNRASLDMALKKFNEWSRLVEEGKAVDLEGDDLKKYNAFKKTLIYKQKVVFPELRGGYFLFVNKDLYKDYGLSASTLYLGSRDEKNWHVVSYSPSSLNGQNTMDYLNDKYTTGVVKEKLDLDGLKSTFMEEFLRLRFKEVRFNLDYTGKSSDYKSFKVDSYDESTILVWDEEGNYRIVE